MFSQVFLNVFRQVASGQFQISRTSYMYFLKFNDVLHIIISKDISRKYTWEAPRFSRIYNILNRNLFQTCDIFQIFLFAIQIHHLFKLHEMVSMIFIRN